MANPIPCEPPLREMIAVFIPTTSPLRLISGPERIECGWWDSGFAVLDYFIAQGEESACYWIYRERAGEEAGWFLHGLFA